MSAVDNVLMEHRAVLEAAVVGVDVNGFTRIRAHVACRRDVTPGEDLVGELDELSKTRLQRYQYPHDVELAETMTGTVQRFVLRQKGAPA